MLLLLRHNVTGAAYRPVCSTAPAQHLASLLHAAIDCTGHGTLQLLRRPLLTRVRQPVANTRDRESVSGYAAWTVRTPSGRYLPRFDGAWARQSARKPATSDSTISKRGEHSRGARLIADLEPHR